MPEYVAHLEDGNPDAALATILRRNPVPGITGHICTHLCQTRCTRSNVDRPVGIRDLKRFAVEHGHARLAPAAPTGKQVAVVGAGPSGLAAAFHLALAGVAVTVFEAKDRAGGMPALAPAFRLPPDVVAADMARIEALGVSIRTKAPIASPRDLLAQGFAAVYLATGFPRDSMPEDVAGIGVEGVYGAVDFLDRVAHGRPPSLGASVVVIGGGNTAMDAARAASRLSRRPCTVAYRRTRAEMPADAEEVALLLEEGNVLLELVSPVSVVAEHGRAVAVECVRNRLGEPWPDGRRRPEPVPGTNLRLPADAVIVATGQSPDRSLLRSWKLEIRPDGAVVVDEATGRATPDRIYAGGDLVRGPATVVAAAADGRRAAEAILVELGIPLPASADREAPSSSRDVEEIRRRRARRAARQEPTRLPAAKRHGFELVTSSLRAEAAREEAARCLQCATVCDKCVQVCPNRANVPFEIAPLDVQVPVVSLADGAVVNRERVSIAQPRQILHVDDLCNECGNCTTFCVHEGKPYAEKPRLFWDRAAFDAALHSALFVDGAALHAKTSDGTPFRVILSEDGYAYEDADLTAHLTPTFAVIEVHPRRKGGGTRSLRAAVEAAALFRALRTSAPFILPNQEEGAS